MIIPFKNYRKHLAAAGRELELSYDGDLGLTGQHDGIEVGVLLWSTKDSEGNTSYYTTARASYGVNLRMSLALKRLGMAGRMWRALTDDDDIKVGAFEFDKRFEVRCRDASRVRALLADEGLRRQMLVVAEQGYPIQMTDTAVTTTDSGWETDVADIRGMLQAVFDVARRVRDRYPYVPKSDAERRAAAGLSAVGSDRGLLFDENALTLEGRLMRNTVTVHACYHRRGFWTTDFDVRFAQDLGLGIRLHQQSTGFFRSVAEFFGAQDIEVGHARFDATFVVKGEPESDVTKLLGGQVAERVLALHAVAKELHVSDTGIKAVAAGLVDEPRALDSSLRNVGELADAIMMRVQGRPDSPYR